MTNRTNYIEFRVYLRDELSNVDRTNVLVLADQMQDVLADFVSESNECRPEVFTGDVTYDTNLDEPEPKPTTTLTYAERMQVLADLGVDTWEEYREEN